MSDWEPEPPPETYPDEPAVPVYDDARDQYALARQVIEDWVAAGTDIHHALDRITAKGCAVRVNGAYAEALADNLAARSGVGSARARPTKSGWRVMVDFTA